MLKQEFWLLWLEIKQLYQCVVASNIQLTVASEEKTNIEEKRKTANIKSTAATEMSKTRPNTARKMPITRNEPTSTTTTGEYMQGDNLGALRNSAFRMG